MTLKLVAYTPKWQLRPGESVPVHVSSEFDRIYAQLVRFNSAIGPDGEWQKSTRRIPASCDGSWPVEKSVLNQGSCIQVDYKTRSPIIALGFKCWFHQLPTCLSTLVELQIPQASVNLSIGERGTLLLDINHGAEHKAPANDEHSTVNQYKYGWLPSLKERTWFEVVLVINSTSGTCSVIVKNLEANSFLQDKTSGQTIAVYAGLHGISEFIDLQGFVVGGRSLPSGHISGDLDAKIEALKLWNTLPDDQHSLFTNNSPSPIAHWNLGNQEYVDRVPDTHGSDAYAWLINGPTRAVTSSQWSGQSTSFVERPEHYAAVALHADDIDDAGWPFALELSIPSNAKSGVYCLILSEQEQPDYNNPSCFYPLPIFVLPQSSGTSSTIALVLPTFSYRTYANNTLYEEADARTFRLKGPTRSKPIYDYCLEQQLKSLYCEHADGTGVHLATLKRPQVSVRPDLISQLHSFPHQLSADLEIVEWLESNGYAYDILTDEVLHDNGPAALLEYKVVLTGSHPEYATEETLNAYDDYRLASGNLMYLGGNGFDKRVSVCPERPWILELRRGDADAVWSDAPGEMLHQTDGKQGGLWRRIGRPPNVTFGLGYSAIGFSGDGDYIIPSECNIDLLPEKLRQVLQSLGRKQFGIAGLELDCHDVSMGSSSCAIVFGEINEMPGNYTPTHEYLGDLISDPVAAVEQSLRANLIWVPAGARGNLFSVGSIRWAAGLNTVGDPYAVSAITGAALNDMLHGS